MSLHFYSSPREIAEQDLTNALQASLGAEKKVLLLLSGGSNIASGVHVANALEPTNLTISLVDERYGDVGHEDSNMATLERAGLDTELPRIPVLTGKSFNETVEEFEQSFQQAVEIHDEIYALFGIGTDGHIAGILPRSPALEAIGPVVGYKGPDHLRISLTLDALKQIGHAYVFAFGESKVPALEALARQTTTLTDQPSQILHEMQDVHVYNEFLETNDT